MRRLLGRRRKLWICVETVHRDGTRGSWAMLRIDVGSVLEVKALDVAVITITDLETGEVLAAVAPLPAHPARRSASCLITVGRKVWA